MEYINPFRLFELPAEASTHQINAVLQDARVKLQREQDQVYIRGSRVSKEALKQAVQDLQDKERRAYHQKVLDNRPLLNFLEYGHLSFLEQANEELTNYSKGFLEFIAPYFGYQYSEALLQATKTNDEKTLELLRETKLPTEAVITEAVNYYEPTINYVNHTIQELQQLQERQELVSMSEREIVSHLSDKTIKMYNMLPDQFHNVRNLIAQEVYKLAVVLISNYGRQDGAQVMVKQGLKLNIDNEIKEKLNTFLKRSSFNFRLPIWVWIGFGIVALLFLMKYLETTFLG